MISLGVLGVVCPPAAGSASDAPVQIHAPKIPVGPSPAVSGAARVGWRARNWSGYAIAGSGFTSATGHWNVPQVTTSSGARFSSDWVGIDGFNNSNLIQAGTEEDVIGGQPFYEAWWEILPSPETPISSISVQPGDAMSVSVSNGGSTWTITVTDTTSGQSFTTHQAYSGPGSSAEWIHEAPTIGTHVATLAKDSPVTFDLCTLNGASPNLAVTESGVMVKSGRVISTPSAPDSDGDGFTVAYGRVAPSPPSS